MYLSAILRFLYLNNISNTWHFNSTTFWYIELFTLLHLSGNFNEESLHRLCSLLAASEPKQNNFEYMYLCWKLD